MFTLFCCKKRAKRRNASASYKVAALIALLDGSPARTERALQRGLINTISDNAARNELQSILDEIANHEHDFIHTVTPAHVEQLINHVRYICYSQRAMCFFKSSSAYHFDCFFDSDNNYVMDKPSFLTRVML